MNAEVKPIRIMAFDRYALYAPSTTGGNRAKLVWSVRDGNPRVTVFTNDNSDTIGRGIISAPMDPLVFYSMIDLLRKASMASSEVKYKVDCLTSVKDEAGKVVDKILLSSVIVGKDSDGIVWISVVAEGRPTIKFIFTISDYHKLYKNDGSQFTAAEVSAISANATIASILPIYQHFMQEAVVDQINRPKQTAGAPAATTATTAAYEFEDIPQ